MFCKICGNELNEQVVVCPKCGCAIVEDKKIKTSIRNTDTRKLFNILRYIAALLISLSIMFVFIAIFGSSTDLYYSKYTDTVWVSWYTDSDFSVVGIIFASFGFIPSLVNFILSFKDENKKKRFSSDITFMISILTIILSIVCISYS